MQFVARLLAVCDFGQRLLGVDGVVDHPAGQIGADGDSARATPVVTDDRVFRPHRQRVPGQQLHKLTLAEFDVSLAALLGTNCGHRLGIRRMAVWQVVAHVHHRLPNGAGGRAGAGCAGTGCGRRVKGQSGWFM